MYPVSAREENSAASVVRGGVMWIRGGGGGALLDVWFFGEDPASLSTVLVYWCAGRSRRIALCCENLER